MPQQETKKIARPPIVVVMGHVDHGKTTLLDYIRKTNTASREAGGITQAVGAYEIIHDPKGSPSINSGRPSETEGRKITFIDTPGHEAFTQMRSRGAQVADLAILVVAGDEGLKPQTKEAIQILGDSKTPFVVAINKIDKPDANLEKVKNELTAAGVLLEGYGGNISYHGISAKTGEGVGDLLDLILLAADVEHLAYDPTSPAKGYILEVRADARRGTHAIAIVKDGTLRVGDFVATATAEGKIKILEDFLGKRTNSLEPSSPAVILGFESAPAAGEEFTASEERAERNEKTSAPAERNGATLPPREAKNELRLILKAEDSGSLEALSLIMKHLETEKPIAVLVESIGDITDSDVKRAVSSQAIIIGFKVKPNPGAKTLAQANNIAIITSAVVYELVKAVETFLTAPGGGLVTAELEILAVFNQKKLDKQIVGGKVIGGTLKHKASFEIKRGNDVAGQGRILSLQSQKKETNEVATGSEAGLLVSATIAIVKGDHLVVKK